jgi:hypothetical protein
VGIGLGNDKINVLLDSESQISIITEEIYEKLKSKGYSGSLPGQSMWDFW